MKGEKIHVSLYYILTLDIHIYIYGMIFIIPKKILTLHKTLVFDIIR